MTVDKIMIYTQAELIAIAKRATNGRRDEVWLADMYAKIASMVRVRPVAYRTFGPWWWAIKAQMVEAGAMAGELDDTLAEAVTMGSKVLDMSGALAYHGYNVEQMRDGGDFTVDTVAGGTINYALHDPEFEARISAG